MHQGKSNPTPFMLKCSNQHVNGDERRAQRRKVGARRVGALGCWVHDVMHVCQETVANHRLYIYTPEGSESKKDG